MEGRTVREVRRAKVELQESFGKALYDFEKKFDVKVDGIYLGRDDQPIGPMPHGEPFIRLEVHV